MSRPPARWLDAELPQGLEAALSSADEDAPDAAIERVRARLEVQIGHAFEGALQPSAADASQLVRQLLRAQWPVLGAILALGMSALWFRGPAVSADVAHSATKASVVRDAASEAPRSEIAVQKPAAEPETSRPAVSTLPAAAPSVPLPASTTRSGPSRAAARIAKPAAPVELGLAEELRQLNHIKQQLVAAPERALVAADEHALRFPHGTLGPERELLRVAALVRLGCVGEARTLAERMLLTPQGYPYRAQLTKLLAHH